LGYILVNAAAFGALFAYVSGSSLFLINVVGLDPEQYGLVFAATSLGIMAGALLNGRLGAWGVAPTFPLTIGLALAAIAAMLLLMMTLADWMPLALVISLLVLGTFGFGLIAPNAMQGRCSPCRRLQAPPAPRPAASRWRRVLLSAGSSRRSMMNTRRSR
jgi:MFS transporter, DHA1 family, multidrug resistance protein